MNSHRSPGSLPDDLTERIREGHQALRDLSAEIRSARKLRDELSRQVGQLSEDRRKMIAEIEAAHQDLTIKNASTIVAGLQVLEAASQDLEARIVGCEDSEDLLDRIVTRAAEQVSAEVGLGLREKLEALDTVQQFIKGIKSIPVSLAETRGRPAQKE